MKQSETFKDIVEKLEEFNKVFDIPYAENPTNISEKGYKLRYELMKEETDEYKQACKDDNLVEIADALGDQLYILVGTILAHGMQNVITKVFDEIHRSNMTKLPACENYTSNDGNCQDPDCTLYHRKPLRREDGKIIKGPLYEKPKLVDIVYDNS